MTLPVVAIRPEPGCAATVAAGVARGLDMIGEPLFDIVPRTWAAPAAGSIDALLVGSANAFRYGGPALDTFRGQPVVAVGDATAEAARAAGFAVMACGRGGLQALMDTLTPPLRLLRLAGEERLELVLPPGIAVDTRVVYASLPRRMSPALAQSLKRGAVVLLHSGMAARHFAAECDRLGIARSSLSLAALGPRIADMAGAGWQSVTAADKPNEGALLALAADLCHAGKR